MRDNKWFQFGSITVLLLLILPFLWVIQYSQLRLDDYCRAGANFGDFFSNVRSWYMTHNGRYTNSFFSNLPVYNLIVYRGVLLILSLLFIATSFKVFAEIFRLFQIKLDRFFLILITLFFLALIFSILPEIDEFLYWFAGATVYQVSAIFFMFFLVHILEFSVYGRTNFIFLGLLTLLINGNTELLLGTTNLLLILLIFKQLYLKSKLKIGLILVNLISWFSSIIVINAPATALRRSQFENGGDLLISAKVALIYGSKFIGLTISNPLTILFLGLLFFTVIKLKVDSRMRYIKINPILLGAISYICVLSMVFITYYATGSFFSYDPGRVGNLILIVLVLFLILNLINLIIYYSLYSAINSNLIVFCFPIIFFGFVFFTKNNFQKLIQDFKSLKNYEYSEAFEKRQSSIIEQTGDILILDKIDDTNILKSGTNNLEEQDWVKSCYLEYVNNNYKKNFKGLIIENAPK